MQGRGALLRILGVSFGLAVIVGGTVGVGILRTPGSVAARLGDSRLVLGIWILGGLYALLGSIAVAELATMLPSAGGFYVYARRAFGDGAGLMVGSSDCLGQCVAIAYAAVSMGEFAAALVPPLAGWVTAVACATIALFGLLQWWGLRASSRVQEWGALLKGLAFAALIAACFWSTRAPASHAASAAPSLGRLFVPFFVALQSVIVTYDGWHCAIYFSEENRDPARQLPRSLIGGSLLVTAIYLVVNLAFLRVLAIPQLAASKLPAADAIGSIAGGRAAGLVTGLALLSLLPLINALMLCSPRILYGMSRDGLLAPRAAWVNPRGTPAVMWIAIAAALLFAATGTFEKLVAIAGFLFVVNHCSAFVSLMVLRRREPGLPRPFRAWVYPWSTLAALGGGVSYLVGSMISDPVNSSIALGLILAGYPAYKLAHRWRTPRASAAGAGD